MLQLTSTLAMLCMALPALAADLPTSRALFEIDLQDQYGQQVLLPGQDAHATILLVAVADRKGAEANRAWAAQLAERYGPHLRDEQIPGLKIVPVAHLAGVPRFVRGFVRRGFRGSDPTTGDPTIAIALDWRGQAAGQIPFVRGVPNMIVLDRQGRVRLHTAGEIGGEAETEVLDLLDHLLSPGTDIRAEAE
jgi:hypothetical protein